MPRIYLDTSILVKRYVKEEGSAIADEYFHQAERGESVICLSEINLGEAAVVFDKYSRKMDIDARNRMQVMLSELRSLERSSSVEIYPVDSHTLRKAIKIVLEYHIYVVDAIQLETCIEAGATLFCSGDTELNAIARRIGIETVP
ncbi:type II toxin-antitoxin system VapC family toxin [Thermoplasma sp. Kam2015]|uniref:type II toxin-antitoxin system VapC family toxin n=1 Tax=Thermoplasma sp. Kam2015 TaxID=2094122 RepID=UPI00137A76D7|nr:type II toxin-antitoxin system VapC family toxin [Thermoplasma sp. Kam2015]